jgi:hypothetical protein
MTIEELAKFIFEHRLAKLATGEDGIVNPVSIDIRGRLNLEEWALTQARKLKTKERYLEVQAEATERLRKAVNVGRMNEARDGVAQGLEIQAAFARLARDHKLLN